MDVLEDNLANLRVASFSYYLKPGESHDTVMQKINSQTTSTQHSNDAKESIVLRVKSPLQDPDAVMFSMKTCPQDDLGRVGSCSNGEIGVFGAEKYFNMRLEYGAAELNNEPKLNVRPKAPSVSSEASSRNSQAALLPPRKGSQATTPRKASSTRRIFASLGCSGPCLDKGAISIAERSKRVDNLAFPPVNSTSENTSQIKKPQLMVDHDHNKIFEESRKSLEVFGSGRMKNRDVAENLAKKLSMLTWDAIPKSSAKASTTTIGSTTICDDMTSEASSDLFEIEDISGNGIGCYAPSKAEYNYAPSEASIEWSVVTASAAEFSCGRSDYDEKTVAYIRADSSSSKKMNTRGRPGGLLGCKSHKAVNVAQTVVQKTKVVERY